MIEVVDWSREVVLGERAWVTFRLIASDGSRRPPLRPVNSITIDARIDGVPGHTVEGKDLRAVTGLSLEMRKTGTYSLHITTVDSEGCADETGAYRPTVVVMR